MTERKREAKSEREALSRRRIREAVVRIVGRGGSGAVTMDLVAAEAGVAKGTLYLSYRSKKQLLDSVKEESLRPMREELHGILASSLGPEEKIRRLVRRHLEYFDEHRDFFRVLLWDRELLGGHARRRQSNPYQALVMMLAEVLKQGVAAGIFRPMNSVKVGAMLLEADIAVIGQRLAEEKPVPVQEDSEMLLDLYLFGIASCPSADGSRPPDREARP